MKSTHLLSLLCASTHVLALPSADTTRQALNETAPTYSNLETRGIEKRYDFSNGLPKYPRSLKITFYEKPRCEGESLEYPNKRDNIKYYVNRQKMTWPNGKVGIRSYKLSRDLEYNEVLEWRTYDRDDMKNPLKGCAKFYKTAPFKQAARLCQPLGVPINCWKLWMNPLAEDKGSNVHSPQ